MRLLRFSIILLVVLGIAGAETNDSDLYNAIRSENVKRVEIILARNTNVVDSVWEKNFTPLHFAARHSSSNGLEILKLLLSNGAKVEVKNHIGQTPLFSAVIYNNPEGIKILTEHDAKVNVRQGDGRTPLQWAVNNSNKDVADLLRQHGAKE